MRCRPSPYWHVDEQIVRITLGERCDTNSKLDLIAPPIDRLCYNIRVCTA
jgi:hypothetical protein